MKAPVAILVPTKIELDRLEPHLEQFRAVGTQIELCGWGPVVAAARTSQILAQLQQTQLSSKGSHDLDSQSILLLGIAGRLPGSNLETGAAYEFNTCTLEGIGVGLGEQHQPASKLGWELWPGLADTLQATPTASTNLQLLTVCSASADPSEAQARQARFPNASAEDMEAFAVMTAASIMGYSIRVVRGISNDAGFRHHRQWKIDEALESAANLATEMVFS